MSGTRVRLFPQADSGFEPETVTLSVPAGAVGPGPSDADLRTVSPVGKRAPYAPPGFLPPWRGPALTPAMPDAQGQLDRIEPGTPQFLAAHLYGGVRFTLDVWEGWLGRKVRWWHADRMPVLELVPFLDWNNAQSGPGFIETGWRLDAGGERNLFALNFDVIAHEVGHAILFGEAGAPPPDQLHEAFLALHESISDLVAVLASLCFASVRQRLLADSAGDLYALNNLNRIGEISPTEQIRFAANVVHMDELEGVGLGADGEWVDPAGLGRRAHHLSAPFTGSVFACLVELFQDGLVQRGALAPDDDVRGWTREEVADAVARSGPLTAARFVRYRTAFDAALREARDTVGLAVADAILALDPVACDFDGVAGVVVQGLVRRSGPSNLLAFLGHFRRHGIEPLLAPRPIAATVWRSLPYAERMRRVREAARRRRVEAECRPPCSGNAMFAASRFGHEERAEPRPGREEVDRARPEADPKPPRDEPGRRPWRAAGKPG